MPFFPIKFAKLVFLENGRIRMGRPCFPRLQDTAGAAQVRRRDARLRGSHDPAESTLHRLGEYTKRIRCRTLPYCASRRSQST